MIPEGDPKIAEWKPTFDMIEPKANLPITINVEPDVVDSGEIAFLQDMINVLQHFPHHIANFIFGMDIKFREILGSELNVPDEQWKSESKYQRWIHRLNHTPFMIFFLSDYEARFYSLIGDLIADNKVKYIIKDGVPYIEVGGEEPDLMTQRAYDASWYFYIYCHNTGFDPQPAIESLIAEFKLPITFEEVKQHAEDAIKKGVKIGVKYIKNK